MLQEQIEPMTSRARPVKRSNKSSLGFQEHRNLYLNLGFGLVVVVAVLILGGAAAATWYGQHLAPVAHVNGQAITRDDLVKRFRIESVRLTIAENRLQTEHSAGRLSDSDLQQQVAFIEQAQNQLASTALDRLIDERIQLQLAQQQGITVTPDQIDAQLTKEATLPEQRHIWSIEVEPKLSEGADAPTDQQKADASKAADQALADLKAGKDWVEVSKAVSTRADADTGGDLGWLSSDTSQIEAPFRDALFKLDVNGRTDVILGEDGTYRIGRVTDIAQSSVDPTYQQQITDKGVSMADYREVVQSDLVRTALSGKIQAQALQEGPQRHVAEIYIKAQTDQQTGEVVTPSGSNAVRVRHILYSPNDNSQAAPSLAPGDAAWTKAEDQARAAWQKVVADPSLFPKLASDESDDTGSASNGGLLPGWQEPGSTNFVSAFADAIFKPGLQQGQILDPVKTEFGWHVIQIVAIGSDVNEANAIKTKAESGTDFGSLAKEFSDGTEADKGGDIGWIARFQKAQDLENAIFNTPVGKVSNPVSVSGDGVYVFKILGEETRKPTADEEDALKNDAFTNWYAAQKKAFNIVRDADQAGG
jgi:parvulin-like peptidyl-prolyl isomerase